MSTIICKIINNILSEQYQQWQHHQQLLMTTTTTLVWVLGIPPYFYEEQKNLKTLKQQLILVKCAFWYRNTYFARLLEQGLNNAGRRE